MSALNALMQAERTPRSASLTGTGRLLLGVFELTLRDFTFFIHASDARGRRLWKEAHDWLFDEEAAHFTSCRNTCEVLSVNHGALLDALRRRMRLSLKVA